MNELGDDMNPRCPSPLVFISCMRLVQRTRTPVIFFLCVPYPCTKEHLHLCNKPVDAL